MMNLTFGEQVKIILSRKGMTIKELAEKMEEYTGKSMSRQNMTQRLHRDNFQEQDMRLIAKILGCQFQLSIMEMTDEPVLESAIEETVAAEPVVEDTVEEVVQEELHPLEREITVEELVEMAAEVEEEAVEEKVIPDIASVQRRDEERELLRQGISGYFKKNMPAKASEKREEEVEEKKDSKEIVGDINPYTGKEYQSNSVRMHPKRIGYVQVYDREQHKWTDMTEWAFLGYQERKKLLLGKDYVPPIYLD